MASIRAWTIHKGGVGKTTMAVADAGAQAAAGKRVLGIDLDPQGVFSEHLLGGDPADLDPEVILADALFDAGQLPTTYTHDSGIEFWPATEEMFGVDRRLISTHPDRARALAHLIDQVRDRYDTIIIDCPPAFSPLHDAALFAAEAAILPLWAERGSMRALKTWMTQWSILKKGTGRAAQPLGLVITQIDDSALTRELLPELRELPLPVLAELPRTVRLKAAQNDAKTIQQYAPKASITQRIEQLATIIDKLTAEQGSGHQEVEQHG